MALNSSLDAYSLTNINQYHGSTLKKKVKITLNTKINFETYKVAAVDESTCGERGLVSGQRLH